MRTAEPVTIAGAGPAGLAAAIAIAQHGGRAVVRERHREVGARFHGDFQGLENWSSERDVLAELEELGIAPTFDVAPFSRCVLFDPAGRAHHCRSAEPLWYLVRRGPGPGTLDTALKDQALAAGVSLELGHVSSGLPEGGIVAHGPRRADVVAVGYLAATDAADGAYGVVSPRLAPGGYAYLLVSGGRATLATCLFDRFREAFRYLEHAVDFFRERTGVTLRDARRFGGFGAYAVQPLFRLGNLLFAGEAAGLQDALLGFGIRYALLSGHLAGQAVVAGDLASYERACLHRFGAALRTTVVNRYLFDRAGGLAARHLLWGVSLARNPRRWLRRYYGSRWLTSLLYPLARSWEGRRRRRGLDIPRERRSRAPG